MLGEYVSLVDESLVMLRRSHDSKLRTPVYASHLKSVSPQHPCVQRSGPALAWASLFRP